MLNTRGRFYPKELCKVLRLKVVGTSFLAGELATLVRHPREKRAKEARDLKGEKFKTNMAARGFFRSTKLLSYFVRSLPTSVYLMYSTDTVYAGDRNENKEDDSWRHKGCFASKRKIQSIRNLATAKKERTRKNSTIGSENPKTRFYGGSESNDFRVACGVAQTNIGKTLEILNIELGSLYERHAKAFFF